MRTAPPLQVTVVRFGVWRTALGALMAISAAAVGAWLAADAVRPVAVSVGGAAVTALVLAGAGLALRTAEFRLRWDGERWHVSATSPRHRLDVEAAGWSGRIDIAIDAGTWLLLKFNPDFGPPGCPYRWLPVQRRGLEWQWHALRTALYCARPAGANPSTAASHDLAE